VTCPQCRSEETSVRRTANAGDRISRYRSCRSCGGSWWSDEEPRKGTFVHAPARDTTHAIGAPRAAPMHETPPSPSTGSGGGVGGGLSPGSDLGPIPLPEPSQQSDLTRTREAPSGPIRERRPAPWDATTLFRDCFDRYPRKDAKVRAANVWQQIAEDFPGGEQGLRGAILARFDAGQLDHAPYRGPWDKRPYFETYLLERRWEDPESAPDDIPSSPASKAERSHGAIVEWAQKQEGAR
jgi:hypothetical protein